MSVLIKFAAPRKYDLMIKIVFLRGGKAPKYGFVGDRIWGRKPNSERIISVRAGTHF
jgi:hypothetical protein